MNICVIGDSITYGEGDTEMGGWVQRMRLNIEDSLPTDRWVQVYNLGIPGDTTEGVLARIKNELIPRDPFFVVIAIGINDSAYRIEKSNNDISLEQFSSNISGILDVAIEFSEKNVLCVGLTRVDEKFTQLLPDSTTGKCYANDVIEKYDNILKNLCEQVGVPFIQVSSVVAKEDLIDGLHPSSIGYIKLQKQIEPFIRAKINL